MCSVRPRVGACYPSTMQPEQRIIAAWIKAVSERLGWSYAVWAKRADIGAATTITRALKDDYESVTSVKTLHALAKAAGERSILDLLEEQASGAERASEATGPSVEAVEALLSAVLPLLPSGGRVTEQSLRAVSAALAHGLELLGDQRATNDSGSLSVAARGAVSRFRDLTRQ